MKKPILIFLLALSSCLLVTAQGETDHWFFGDKAGISFTKDSVVAREDFTLYAWEGCASISTPEGALMYYSDGVKLYDYKHRLISDSLKAYRSSVNGALFLKHPSSEHYYLTTTYSVSVHTNSGFYYSIILPTNDTSTILQSNKLLRKNCTEAQSATFHQNNRDIWVIVDGVEGNFYNFLLKKEGFICCPVVQNIGLISPTNSGGAFKFSPSGKRFARPVWGSRYFELYDYNNESGRLASPIKVLLDWGSPVGASFSPNENVLYVVMQSSTTPATLFQYDISSNNVSKIRASKVQIVASDNFGFMQLAKNNKLYFPIHQRTYLGSIENPDSLGKSCNFRLNAVSLGSKKGQFGITTFNQSYFYDPTIDFSYEQNCKDNTFTFEGRDTFGANSFLWEFKNPDGKLEATRTSKNTSYSFLDPGKWQVRFIASNSSRSDTVIKTITIYPVFEKDFLGVDTFYCESTTGIVLKTPPNLHCVHWMGDHSYGQSDTFQVDTAGTYFVKATNKGFCTTNDTITIIEYSNPLKPNIRRSNDTLYCDSNSANYKWYLNDVEIIGANNKFYILKENGNYSVQVINAHKCSALSDHLLVDNIGINLIEELGIKIYPNPTEEYLYIGCKNGSKEFQNLYIVDLQGKIITFITTKKEKTFYKIDVRNIPAGVYSIKFEYNGLFHSRIVLIE